MSRSHSVPVPELGQAALVGLPLELGWSMYTCSGSVCMVSLLYLTGFVCYLSAES